MNVAATLKTLTIAATLAGMASTALADSGHAYVTGTNPSMLKVKSNGQAYTQFDLLGNFTIVGRLKFDTGIAGHIKSWQAFPNISNGYGIAAEIPNMVNFKKSDSYPIFQRPHKIDLQLPFSIPKQIIQNAAVSMCNKRADDLRAQGKSNLWIFGQHQYVHFKLRLDAWVDSNGAGSGDQLWQADVSPHEFKVRCMKWTGVQIPTYDGPGLTHKPQQTHGNDGVRKSGAGGLVAKPQQTRRAVGDRHRILLKAKRRARQ